MFSYLLEKSSQLEVIRRSEPQEGPMDPPVPHIKIETTPPLDLFHNLFREMGMAENDDFKALLKLTMSKGPKGWRGYFGRRTVIELTTLLAHPVCNSP